MYLYEQHMMYRIAFSLVKNNQFEVIHINKEEAEIWLEKYQNKTSHIIRLIHKGFDWKNHLKKDIALVFRKINALKKSRQLLGKKIEIHNIYVASHAPVDDWESLKKPILLESKKSIQMKVYYLEEYGSKDERARLHQDIGVFPINTANETPEIETKEQIKYYKKHLSNALYDKRKEIETVFSFGKPFFTYLLLLVNVVLFFILELNGGSTNTNTLIQYGAKYNPAILDGEWWRLITSMFLHIGIVHIFMNMLALYYLGTVVERIYGSWRFLVIYFLAGFGGGLSSFAFSFNVSAGASGAIFGLFGALLFFGLIYKRIFFQTMGKGILILIGVNILFGLLVPQIDNAAHIGGLIAGFLASGILHLPRKRKISTQFLAFILYSALISAMVIFGINNNENSASFQLSKIDELIDGGKYEAVIDQTSKRLDNPGNHEALLLFQRAFAYIKLDMEGLAIKDLEKSITINQDLPQSYYNLALLYFNRGEQDKAKEAVTKAYDIKPNDEAYEKLYEQITGG